MVAPVRIALELRCTAKDRAATRAIPEKYADQAVGNLLGHLPEIELSAGADRALDAKFVAIVAMQLDQPLNDQRVQRKTRWGRASSELPPKSEFADSAGL